MNNLRAFKVFEIRFFFVWGRGGQADELVFSDLV